MVRVVSYPGKLKKVTGIRLQRGAKSNAVVFVGIFRNNHESPRNAPTSKHPTDHFNDFWKSVRYLDLLLESLIE